MTIPTYTSEDYHLYRVYGNWFAAAAVAGTLSADESLSPEVRQSWAANYWTMYWRCDEHDRAELREGGYAPDLVA